MKSLLDTHTCIYIFIYKLCVLTWKQSALTPRLGTWLNKQPLPLEQKKEISFALEKNGYCSVDILLEEDPEVLFGLKEVKALVPGHRLVLKKAFVDLRYAV